VTVDGNTVKVKGPKGELSHKLPSGITVDRADTVLNVQRASEETVHRSLHGLTRSLIANMVEGVTKGYQKQLEITGVGYKAEVRPYGLQLALGFSHPSVRRRGNQVDPPAATSPPPTPDKGAVGVRTPQSRPPEPYKGRASNTGKSFAKAEAGGNNHANSKDTRAAAPAPPLRKKYGTPGVARRRISLNQAHRAARGRCRGRRDVTIGPTPARRPGSRAGQADRGPSQDAGITRVVFDRAGTKYHGRVKRWPGPKAG
jgi:large subunit ribosomal protein L6